MAKKYTGRLELEWYNKQKSILLQKDEDARPGTDVPAPKMNWINKDEALFYEIDEKEGRGLKPYWVNRDDIRVKEARPLVFQKGYKAVQKNKKGSIPETDIEWKVEELNKDDPTIENILIKGDNLLALNTLKKMFDNKPDEEKVKCIYIDPPYNTGSAFENYDDNLLSSEWLTMNRDRLVLLYNLLKNNGIIFISIDDDEVARLRILLDEIFGSNNYIRTIAYQRGVSSGIGQSGSIILNTTEFILVYAKDKTLIAFNEVFNYFEIAKETMIRYNSYISSIGNKKLIKSFLSKSNGEEVKIFKHDKYMIDTISLKKYDERILEIKNEYLINYNNIFRTTNPQSNFQQELIENMEEGLYSVEYVPSRGNNKGILTTNFFYNRGLCAWLKDTSEITNNTIMKKEKINDFWPHSEIPKADLSNEGGVMFQRSKKPEQLIKRIFELSTQENDVILDCFGGSGTTYAVAHKMKRKWIGVEIGKHADTHILPRMKYVIDGSDKSGVSKSVNWSGGGSFKYYHLGPSIIKSNKDSAGNFNWSLGVKFIEESLLASYDYTIVKDVNFTKEKLFKNEETIPAVGIQKIGTRSRAAIVTLNPPEGKKDMISYEEVMSLYEQVKSKYSPEYINIFTNRGVEISEDSRPDDLEIIKVPHAIFAELEK